MPSARSSWSRTSLCSRRTSPSSTTHAQALHWPSRQLNGASTPFSSRYSSSTLSPCQSSKEYCSPSSSTSTAIGPVIAGSASSPSPSSSSSASSASESSFCAASTSSTSPKGLPPSETNFSWWRRSRGKPSSLSASVVAFMNGPGPQTKAVAEVKYDA